MLIGISVACTINNKKKVFVESAKVVAAFPTSRGECAAFRKFDAVDSGAARTLCLLLYRRNYDVRDNQLLLDSRFFFYWSVFFVASANR